MNRWLKIGFGGLLTIALVGIGVNLYYIALNSTTTENIIGFSIVGLIVIFSIMCIVGVRKEFK